MSTVTKTQSTASVIVLLLALTAIVTTVAPNLRQPHVRLAWCDYECQPNRGMRFTSWDGEQCECYMKAKL